MARPDFHIPYRFKPRPHEEENEPDPYDSDYSDSEEEAQVTLDDTEEEYFGSVVNQLIIDRGSSGKLIISFKRNFSSGTIKLKDIRYYRDNGVKDNCKIQPYAMKIMQALLNEDNYEELLFENKENSGHYKQDQMYKLVYAIFLQIIL